MHLQRTSGEPEHILPKTNVNVLPPRIAHNVWVTTCAGRFKICEQALFVYITSVTLIEMVVKFEMVKIWQNNNRPSWLQVQNENKNIPTRVLEILSSLSWHNQAHSADRFWSELYKCTPTESHGYHAPVPFGLCVDLCKDRLRVARAFMKSARRPLYSQKF